MSKLAELKASLYDKWYPIQCKLGEFIAWEYFCRIKRRFLKQIDGQKIILSDLNRLRCSAHPRWHLIMWFNSVKAYEEFWKTSVIDVQTFFPKIVRSNGWIIIFVRNEDGEYKRYIL